MKVGYQKGSPEAAIVAKWRTERYHAPSDDVRQPVDLTAAADFNQVMLRLTEAIANRTERPRWNKDSFFRRFATPQPTGKTLRSKIKTLPAEIGFRASRVIQRVTASR